MFGCLNFLVVLFVLFVEMYIYTMLSREKNRVQRLLPRYSYSLFGRDNAEKMSLTQDFALTPRHCCRWRCLPVHWSSPIHSCEPYLILRQVIWAFSMYAPPSTAACGDVQDLPPHRNNSSNYYQDEWLHCCEKGDGIFKTLLVFVHRWVGWK